MEIRIIQLNWIIEIRLLNDSAYHSIEVTQAFFQTSNNSISVFNNFQWHFNQPLLHRHTLKGQLKYECAVDLTVMYKPQVKGGAKSVYHDDTVEVRPVPWSARIVFSRLPSDSMKVFVPTNGGRKIRNKTFGWRKIGRKSDFWSSKPLPTHNTAPAHPHYCPCLSATLPLPILMPLLHGVCLAFSKYNLIEPDHVSCFSILPSAKAWKQFSSCTIHAKNFCNNT